MLNKISAQLDINSDRSAFFINSTYYSYGELTKRVASIQAVIDDRSSSTNQIIAVVANSDLDTYASILAILFSGHGYLPINPQSPVERNIAILQQTDVDLLLSSKNPSIPSLELALPNLHIAVTQGLQPAKKSIYLKSVPDTNFAYLLFTSGSTGIPKGVPISRKNLNAFLVGFFDIVPLHADDRVLQMFDLTFDFSVMSLFAPLVVGACVYPAATDELRFMSVYRLLEEQKVTCAPMVPSVLTFLRPYFEDIKLKELTVSVFCGEPLLAQIAQEWSACGPQMRIINFYGPTEATVFCSAYEWLPNQQKSVNGALSIGKAMSRSTMLVVDEQGSVLPPNQSGELCLAGDQLTTGYWRDPQRNHEAFIYIQQLGSPVRFYRTGDIAYIDEEGDFMYQGRLDQQVKVQGFRIELAEIEHHARLCPGVKQAAAVTTANQAGSIEIVLCLDKYEGDVKEVLIMLRGKLPAYMIPTRVVNFPDLPLNKNGKVDRVALRGLVAN